MKGRDRVVRYLSFLFLVASLLLPPGPARGLAQEELQTGGVTVLLLDDAGAPIGGGSFEIATTHGSWSVTDDLWSGEVVLSGISPGPVTVTHIAGPDGYTTGSSVSAEVTPGGMATATLWTSPVVQQEPEPLPETPAPESERVETEPDSEKETSSSREDTSAPTTSTQSNSPQSVMALNVWAECPVDLSSKTPGEQVTLVISFERTDIWNYHGVAPSSDRAGIFVPDMFTDVTSFARYETNFSTTITDEDASTGFLTIPAPGVVLTDHNGSTAASGEIECAYTPPVITTPIELSGTRVFHAPYCDDDGYHAPRVVVPESTEAITYWAEPGKTVYQPGDTVTVRAEWDSSTHVVDDFGDWMTEGPGSAYQTITFTEHVDCAEPDLDLTKSADTDTFHAPGDVITYTLTVTNTGDIDATGFTLADELEGLSPLACTLDDTEVDAIPGTLSLDQVLMCNATYPVDANDVTAGLITNTATASADGVDPVTQSVTVNLEEVLSLDVDKIVVDQRDAYAAGETIVYEITVTNTSNVTLADITVSDPLVNDLACEGAASDIPHIIPTLPQGDGVTCSASYTVVEDDIIRGEPVTNTVDVTGTSPAGTTVPGGDEITVDIEAPNPLLTVEKSIVDKKDTYAVDEIVHYEIVITNTGNVTLTDVSVTDDLVADLDCGNGSGDIAPLAPGEENATICTASYTVEQGDIDRGEPIVNTASATGIAPDGSDVSSGTSSATVDVEAANPAISLDTSANPERIDAADQEIAYTYTVTNDGNVTLSDIQVSDPMLGDAGIVATCPENPLAPSTSMDCLATYTVSQDAIDAGGPIENPATASATAPNEQIVTSATSTSQVEVEQRPSLSVDMAVLRITTDEGTRDIGADETVTGLVPGDTVHYKVTATNDGNVTLDGVIVSDAMLTDLACSPNGDSLAPGSTITCTGTYTLTEDDVARQDGITIEASASATAPGERTVDGAASVTVWPFVPDPAIELAHTANPTTYDTLGQEIEFTLTVTNTGDVPVTDVSMTETGLDRMSDLDCELETPLVLQPKDAFSCTATYTVTQGDLDAGSITNTAAAEAFSSNDTRASDEAEVTVTADQQPSMVFSKEVSTVNGTLPADPVAGLAVGDTVTYTITAENSGNVTLGAVEITDSPFAADALDCVQPTPVAPGTALECTIEYTVAQSDVDRGVITNDASVVATAPDGSVLKEDASVTVWAMDADPGLTMEKSVAPETVHRAGEQVTWSFTVANIGNVTITDIEIDDPMLAGSGSPVTCPAAEITPGTSLTCTANYTVTQADMDAGVDIVNEASASGLAPERTGAQTFLAAQANPRIITSATASATLVVAQNPGLTLAQTVNAPDDAPITAGTVVTFTFQVTNSGNTSLTSITVDVPMLANAGIAVPPVGDLAPGETRTVMATYTITDADMAAGSIRNVATASNGAIASAPSEITQSLLAPQPEPEPGSPDAPVEPAQPDSNTTPTDPEAPNNDTSPEDPGDTGNPAAPPQPGADENDVGSTSDPEEAAESGGAIIRSLPNTGSGDGVGGSATSAWLGALLTTVILATAAFGFRHRQGV